jgi:hypothetical protein
MNCERGAHCDAECIVLLEAQKGQVRQTIRPLPSVKARKVSRNSVQTVREKLRKFALQRNAERAISDQIVSESLSIRTRTGKSRPKET